jgi:hypothetical protein
VRDAVRDNDYPGAIRPSPAMHKHRSGRSNQEKMGRMCHQHLNFISSGKVHGREAKASNRTGEIPPSGIIGGPRET